MAWRDARVVRAHKELRRRLIENNRVEAVLSLPGGVFNPLSQRQDLAAAVPQGRGDAAGVVPLCRERRLQARRQPRHAPVDEDDLPGLVEAFRDRDARQAEWQGRDPDEDWTANWWFAGAAALRAADFNLSANHHRPPSRATVEHRDPPGDSGRIAGH